jgi:hypothetical protein
VVFRNESGANSPKARSPISVVERDGKLLTPPLSAGLLPGTLRAELHRYRQGGRAAFDPCRSRCRRGNLARQFRPRPDARRVDQDPEEDFPPWPPSLSPRNDVLVVVDMQYDFLPGGSLAVSRRRRHRAADQHAGKRLQPTS